MHVTQENIVKIIFSTTAFACQTVQSLLQYTIGQHPEWIAPVPLSVAAAASSALDINGATETLPASSAMAVMAINQPDDGAADNRQQALARRLDALSAVPRATGSMTSMTSMGSDASESPLELATLPPLGGSLLDGHRDRAKPVGGGVRAQCYVATGYRGPWGRCQDSFDFAATARFSTRTLQRRLFALTG